MCRDDVFCNAPGVRERAYILFENQYLRQALRSALRFAAKQELLQIGLTAPKLAEDLPRSAVGALQYRHTLQHAWANSNARKDIAETIST